MIIGIIIVANITNKIYTTILSNKTELGEKIWNTISFSWKIKDDNNFPIYTHKLENENWEKIYLKSSSINLNNYSWNIEIYGEIMNFQKRTPIIEVFSMKFPDQWLIIKNNTYFFIKDLLYIDFSNQKNLSAKKSTKEIDIYYQWDKIFSIERFLCSRVLRQKDCNYLIEDYGNTQKENFDSYRWYTYYKHGTWLWTIFDGIMFGYVFKNIEQETMLDISSMIRIIDKNFIISNKEKQIKEACNKAGVTIKQIWASSIKYEDNDNISIIIKLNDNQKCEVTFDMWNERNITKTQISKEKDNS